MSTRSLFHHNQHTIWIEKSTFFNHNTNPLYTIIEFRKLYTVDSYTNNITLNQTMNRLQHRLQTHYRPNVATCSARERWRGRHRRHPAHCQQPLASSTPAPVDAGSTLSLANPVASTLQVAHPIVRHAARRDSFQLSHAKTIVDRKF
jgi:hypothetical protein